MKKITNIKAMLLSLLMAVMILPMTMNAQSGGSDSFFKGGVETYDNRDVSIDDGGGISNWGIGETVPLGSGLLILIAIGAGYAIMRRKSYKAYKTHETNKSYNCGATLFLSFALILSITSCKKNIETVTPTPTNGVNITLNVDGNNSKVIVDPTNNGQNNMASVKFETGDIVYVGYNNNYVGSLSYTSTGENTGYFSGSVNIESVVDEQPLHFYFLGGKNIQPDPSTVSDNKLSVVISDQTEKYPVISYNHSTRPYDGAGSYSAKLISKCSIMKFNVTTPSNSAICITGMNNKVTVNFNPSTENTDQGFSYSVNATDGGLIKMPAKDAENVTWAIVLPQNELAAGAAGTVYTADNMYEGSRPEISAIIANQYINAGKALTVNELTPLYTPLTFEANTAGATVTFTKADDHFVPNPVQYSTDGSTWNTYSSGTAITLANKGDKVSFRGDNTAYAYMDAGMDITRSTFSCSADCYIYGNIMSLISSTDYANTKTLTGDDTFNRLFYGNTTIVSHPSKTLVLPATTLTEKCYKNMFYGCTGLTTAPALPAMTLTYQCYECMFEGCTGLTTAPALPAGTLATECYLRMFQSCTSLTTAPALDAMTLADKCYYGMFYLCTSLTTAPVLPAATLTSECYLAMFYKCSNLSSVICLATNISASNCTKEWLSGVASSGTFTKASSMSNWTTGINGIPSGWTVNNQ